MNVQFALHELPHVLTCTRPTAGGEVPIVPYIVRPGAPLGTDLRAALGIPRNATVFGRHGGFTTFDVPYVPPAICEYAKAHPQVYFVMMNTPRICAPGDTPPNVHHLPPTSSDERKSRFIRTCDAMIHARKFGETFGLAVAEFSVHNKPVITCSVVLDPRNPFVAGPDRMHLDVLSNRALLYHDKASFTLQLDQFDRYDARRRDWNAYRAYAPDTVMATFARVFLNGSQCRTNAKSTGK